MYREFVTGIMVAATVLFSCLVLHAEESADEFLDAANDAAANGKSDKAVELASKAIETNPRLAQAYYLRGREHFRLGKVRESVIDLDKFVALSPKDEPHMWERGISYYYDGKFEKGAKQFELYQTFDSADVENSVWRFLCMAADVGVDKARQAMLPIENDRRVPMMEIYDLFRGKLKPDDVLSAANAGEREERVRNQQLFYAHLYIGLFYEATGETALATKHITLAAEKHKIGHYMWDVANVHAKILASRKDKPENP